MVMFGLCGFLVILLSDVCGEFEIIKGVLFYYFLLKDDLF